MQICTECLGKSCGPKGIAHCEEQIRQEWLSDRRKERDLVDEYWRQESGKSKPEEEDV
jgi:hypothetical protein